MVGESRRTHEGLTNNESAAELSVRAQQPRLHGGKSQVAPAFSNFFSALYHHRLLCPQPFRCTAEAPGEEWSPFHHGASTTRAIHRLFGCCRRWKNCYRCQGRSTGRSEGSPGDRRTWRLDYSWLHLASLHGTPPGNLDSIFIICLSRNGETRNWESRVDRLVLGLICIIQVSNESHAACQ